jgi:uncharacterized protein
MHGDVGDIFRTSTFWSGFAGWMVASIIKILVNLRRTRHVDFGYLVSLGGMPSAHSAMVSGLATSVGLCEGFGSTIFVVAFAFAVVVMFDASTVRRATGLQARLLNQVVDEVFKQHHLPKGKLKEILGHTRKEVFVGMLVGIAVGVAINLLIPPAR